MNSPLSADTGSPVIAPPSERDLNDLYYFARVVDEGGFSAAGRALNISKSHLSRRITKLEERLGLRLLQRSTRRLSPTQAGEVYLRYCRSISQLAREADESMLGMLAEPSGQVTVSAPIGLAQTIFPQLLPAFMKRYPKVAVSLHITNEIVDLYSDQVDIALRVRQDMLGDENLIARRFGSSELSLVASRAYLDAHGIPATPHDLEHHATVSFDTETAGPHMWRLCDGHNQPLIVSHRPRLICGDLQILLEAVREDQGVALLPDALWRSLDTEGKLVHVLPQWKVPEGIIYAVYASRRGMTPAIRMLLNYLDENMSAVLRGGVGLQRLPLMLELNRNGDNAEDVGDTGDTGGNES